MPNLNSLTTQDLQWGTANWSGQGYIDGLKMQWVSATAVTVTSGAAFVPSLNKCLPVPNAIPVTGLVLAASTWYHVYLYSNAGVPAIEVVTTAPAAPYNGTARTKTSDTSRRYIGSVLTDSTGNLQQFKVDSAGQFRYLVVPANSGLRFLSNGKATVRTAVSLSGGMPITATNAILQLSNTDSSFYVNFGNPSAATAGPLGVSPGGAGAGAIVTAPTDTNQSVDYYYTTAPTNGFFIDVYGFSVER